MTTPVLVRYERAVELPELGAARRLVMLRRPGLRIYVVRTEGLVVDSRMFAGNAAPLRAAIGPPTIGHLTIPLDGVYVGRRAGRDHCLASRDALIDPGFVVDERWHGPRFAALCVEWSAAYGDAGSGDLRLSVVDHRRIAAMAAAIVDDRFGDAALPQLIELLRSSGVPLHPVELTALDAAPRDAVVLARAFSALHTQLDRSPALTDVEAMVGQSARHIRRRLGALGPWWVLPDADWRASLRRVRVLMAPCLSTARGATVERTARGLGYGSASALLFALAAEGVPPPSVTRAFAGD